MKEIILSRFLIRITVFAASNLSIFCVLLIPFLNSINLTVVQISYLFLLKKAARVITDIPFGILFDRCGGRIILVLSRVFKIISLALILKFNHFFWILSIAMFLDGMAESAIFNKSEVFVYNYFSEKREMTTELYSKMLAIFYFLVDFIYSITGFIGSYLYMKVGRYDIIIIISIVYMILSIFLIFNIKNNNVKSDISINFFRNIGNVLNFIRNSSSNYKNHGIMLSVISFLTWDITTVVGIFMTKINIPTEKIGFMNVIFSMCLSIGCLLPLFIRMKKLNQVVFSFLIVSIFLTIGSFLKSYYILIFGIIILPLVFTISEAFLLSYLDSNISRDERATGIAIFTTLEALLKIIGMLVFASLSEKFNETWGIFGFLLIIILFLLYIIRSSHSENQKKLAFY